MCASQLNPSLTLSHLPESLQAIPYLAGLPLSITINAPLEVITALLARLPSGPPATVALTSSAGGSEPHVPLKQLPPHKVSLPSLPRCLSSSSPLTR